MKNNSTVIYGKTPFCKQDGVVLEYLSFIFSARRGWRFVFVS